jgi:hypothetical protein
MNDWLLVFVFMVCPEVLLLPSEVIDILIGPD